MRVAAAVCARAARCARVGAGDSADARAGGETLTPNTFRTQLHTLARVGLASRAAELTPLAAPETGTSELVSWLDGGCGTTPDRAAFFNTHARASGRSALG